MKRLWQRTMIALARSDRVKDFMQHNERMKGLARRFVAGGDAEAAITVACHLLAEGIRTSFFYLGEYVDRPELVRENVEQKLHIARLLETQEMDVHISVDPTQIGLQTDRSEVAARALAIGRAIMTASAGKPGLHCLMLDMEDASVVDFTLALHDELRRLELPGAITLQAYLRRSEGDLARLIAGGAKVRLVKGAFVGKRDIAFTNEAEIKANYRRLVGMMLAPEARASGFASIRSSQRMMIASRPRRWRLRASRAGRRARMNSRCCSGSGAMSLRVWRGRANGSGSICLSVATGGPMRCAGSGKIRPTASCSRGRCSARRQSSLPFLDPIERPDQHDDVEGEIVADHVAGEQLE